MKSQEARLKKLSKSELLNGASKGFKRLSQLLSPRSASSTSKVTSASTNLKAMSKKELLKHTRDKYTDLLPAFVKSTASKDTVSSSAKQGPKINKQEVSKLKTMRKADLLKHALDQFNNMLPSA